MAPLDPDAPVRGAEAPTGPEATGALTARGPLAPIMAGNATAPDAPPIGADAEMLGRSRMLPPLDRGRSLVK